MKTLSSALLAISAAICTTALSGNLLAQTSSSSSSSSSTSSSSSSGGGGGGPSYGAVHSVCPMDSDGEIVGQDEEGFIEFDPDNYAGSTVVFTGTQTLGGPVSDQQATIVYANGSDFNRPMSLSLYSSDTPWVEQIDFPPTGGWDIWGEVTIPYYIKSQSKLISLSEEGGPNLKKINTWFSVDTSAPGGWGVGIGGSTGCPTTEPTPTPTPSPTPTPTPTPSPSPTPTPPPSQDLDCSIGWPNVWNTGYVLGQITVTNHGSAPIQGWQARISFEEAPQMTNHWSSDIVVDGNDLVATNLDWNKTLQPGQSATFGLQGNHDGSFVAPTCSAAAAN